MKEFIYTKSLSKIRKLTKRIKVIQGSSSAGKTIAILAILIDKALKTPNLSISVVSETTPHLRRGAIRDFLAILKATKRYDDKKWNITNSTYKFLNGSYIEFFSSDQSDKLRGARRDILYINEANLISKDAYLELAMRTNEDIYFDYNPTHPFWNKEVLLDDEAELLVLTYKDNAALSSNVVNFLESKLELAKTSSYWNNWVKVYLYGEEGLIEGVVYKDYEIIDTIPEEARSLIWGCDFGYSQDPTALVHILKYNDYLIIDEVIYQKGLLNSDIANLMKSYDVKGEIYCDAAEPKSIAELKKYGFQAKAVQKGKDSVIYGIQLVQQQKLMVTKKSINILKELENYTWKQLKDGTYDNIPIDAYNHALDALRYGIVSKFGSNKYSGNPSIIIGNFNYK